jgi:predicted esterase
MTEKEERPLAGFGMVTSEDLFPLMIIVGTKDDRVPSSRFPAVPQAFRNRGHIVEVVRPEGVGHQWHVPLNERMWQFLSSHSLQGLALPP